MPRFRFRWMMAALAAPLFLAGQALADFTYSTSTTPTSQTFGTSSVAQFGATASPTGSVLAGSQGISLVAVADQTNASPGATDKGSVPFTDVITITQTAGNGSTGSGSGTLTLTGTITWTRSDSGGQNSSFAFTSLVSSTGGSTLTIGNTVYSLNSYQYAQPTVNQPLTSPSAGSVSGLLTVTAVPEPSSIAALCVGGLLVAAPRLRRLARRSAK